MKDPETPDHERQQLFGGIMERLKENTRTNLSRLRKIEHNEYIVKMARHNGLHV